MDEFAAPFLYTLYSFSWIRLDEHVSARNGAGERSVAELPKH